MFSNNLKLNRNSATEYLNLDQSIFRLSSIHVETLIHDLHVTLYTSDVKMSNFSPPTLLSDFLL